jgi:RHS repeat-associated protein
MSNPLDPFSALESMEVQNTTNGDTTTVAYDSSSRTVTTTTPEGRSSSQVLNTAGRLSATQLPEQDPIDTTYDPQGRLSGGGQGSGLSRRSETRTFRSATTAQGPAGTLQTDTRPEGGAFDYTFDPARRPTSQSLPEGGSLNYGYDDSGNTSSIALPGGQTHQFAYDSRDLLSTYTPPTVAGGGPTGYSYNADRQPTQIDPPGSHEIDFSYGSEGRLGALDTPEGNQTYAYDSGTGQLTSIAGGANTLSLSHDGPLPTGESWSGTVTGSLTRSFDADLRVGSDTVAGSTVNYTYDNDGLPTGTSGQLNATVTRSAASGRVSRIDQGSLREDRGYDPNFAELTSQDVSYSGSARYSTSYTRDHLGRILQKTETIGGQTTTTDYTYDGNGRLTEAKNSGASSTDYVYSYDLNGNRTGGGRTYDNQDRLTGDGTHTYTYTPDGYLWGRTGGSGPVSYSYDSKGELTQASGSGLAGGSTQVDYVYDPLGRRIQRSDGTTTTRYLWDGPRLAAVLDGSNGLLERFVYLTRSNVPDLMKAGGTEYRIVSDQTGSVREVIDTSTGSIVQRIDYDPFGNVTGDTNPGFQPFGFAGGLFDPATGLTRFGARDYDAADGRWTSQDPLSFAAGETNLYSYCGSDPVNLVDPTGTGPGAFYNQASTYFGGSDQLSAVGSLSRLGLLGAAGTVLGLFDASKDLVVGNLKQSFGNSRQAEEGAAQTLKGFTNLGLGSLTAVPALIDVNTSTGFFARATTGPLAVLGAVDAVAVNLAAESIDAAHHGRPTPVDTAVDYWGQTVLGKATVGIWSHFGHSDPAPVLVTRGYGNAMGIKG